MKKESRCSFNEDANPKKRAQGAKITGNKTKWKNRLKTTRMKEKMSFYEIDRYHHDF